MRGFAIPLLAAGLLAAESASGQLQPRIPVPEAFPSAASSTAVEATRVIYNALNPASRELAEFYAAKRGISEDHLVGLNCPMDEEISREDYDDTIAGPLKRIFSAHGWWRMKAGAAGPVTENHVRFVALMHGIPLKIRQVGKYPGDEKKGFSAITPYNQASVDSELAALGFCTRNISGALVNPYYRSFTSIFQTNFPYLMLVCRLDGPTDYTVRRMIEDSIATEKTGLWGFAYINKRNVSSGGLAIGDKWLDHLTDDAMKHGIPCIVENGPALFPRNYPMRNAALYYGWYTKDVAGPFARKDFRFTKGAVACHIHSFSASTLRDPTQNWVAPLLFHGAAASMGNVYEPFLPFTPNLDIFNERLRNGYTFAESAYMSQNVVSWMTTFVGDPLYSPFKILQDMTMETPKSAAEWVAFREGAFAWFDEGRASGERKLRDSAMELGSGIVFEGLGLLQAAAADNGAASESFSKARTFYTNPDDVMRVAIHEVEALRSNQKTVEALSLAQKEIETYPASPAAALLRALQAQIETKGQ